MIFRSQVEPPVTFEPIAFADIVINLFVFFFLCFGLLASFDAGKNGILPIQLPEGGELKNHSRAPLVVVTIDRQGQALLGSKAIPLSRLTQAVNHELKKRKTKTLVVQPDRALTLETFVPVLTRLEQSTAETISIATEIRESLPAHSSPAGS